MFCSQCGQEVSATNRFCGSCGTPLPQKPMMAAGAQSTLHFTRLPLEAPAAAPAPEPAKAAAAPELVPPETSLHEFVQDFQYKHEPSAFDSETTMSGTPIPPSAAKEIAFPAPAAPAPVVETGKFVAPPIQLPVAPGPQIVRPAKGLVEPADELAEGSRFRDLNAAAAEGPRGGTSTIVGPSFLGLSDQPAVAADDKEVLGETRSAWRFWLVLLLILAAVLATLAWLEWRAHKQQARGPVEIIETEIHQLRHQLIGDNGASATQPDVPKPDAQSLQQAQTSQSNSSAAPDMTIADNSQVAPDKATPSPASPQSDQGSPAGAPVAASKAATPADASATKSDAAPATDQAPAAKAAPETAALSATAKPTVSRATPSEPAVEPAPEVATRKTVPGEDEMKKADNASDSAAAAAWLWKATAKGNPDAPVRLADLYIKGDGVPRDCDQALILLRTAAAKQNALARDRLASLYSTGTCVQRDRVQAYKWLSLSLAANPDSEWAQQNRDQVWRQMTADEHADAAKYR